MILHTVAVWIVTGLLAGWVARMAMRSHREYGLLGDLTTGCLAAVQAPVIMMSRNRQSSKDRLDARNDFEVNLRAEMEIMALHEKLDAVRSEELLEVMRILEEQMQRLASLERAVGTDPARLRSET